MELAKAREALGTFLLSDGDLVEALAQLHLAAAIVVEPGVAGSEAQRAQWLGRLHTEMAQAALAQRDIRGVMNHAEEAVRQATLRIRLEPQEPQAFIQRGCALQWRALADIGDGQVLASHRTWRASLEQFRRAPALAPNVGSLWHRLAYELEGYAEQLRRLDLPVTVRDLLAEAVEARRKVVVLDPGTAAHRGALANALHLLAAGEKERGNPSDADRVLVEAQVHLRAAVEAGGEAAVPGLPVQAALRLDCFASAASSAHAPRPQAPDVPPSLELGALPDRFIPEEWHWRSAWRANLPRRREGERLVSAEAAELRRERDGLRALRLELAAKREVELATRAEEDRLEGASRLVLEARQAHRLADDERYAAVLALVEEDEASHRARVREAERSWIGLLSTWIEEDRPFKERNDWEMDGTVRPRSPTLPN
jgi:hypothetical protein